MMFKLIPILQYEGRIKNNVCCVANHLHVVSQAGVAYAQENLSKQNEGPESSHSIVTLDLGEDVKKWVYKNVKYPEDAQNNGQQGRVVVQFVLDTDGSISNVSVKRGVCPSLNDEAVRVISSIPKKLIVKSNKEIVKGVYTMTIPFRLQ